MLSEKENKAITWLLRILSRHSQLSNTWTKTLNLILKLSMKNSLQINYNKNADKQILQMEVSKFK